LFEAVTQAAPSSRETMYAVIGLPPLLAGAIHESVTDAFPVLVAQLHY